MTGLLPNPDIVRANDKLINLFNYI